MSPTRVTPRQALAPKRHKAAHAAECLALEQLPNVGPATADALRQIGIHHPLQLQHEKPLALYERLCESRGQRQDPCVLDTLIAMTDFMSGAPPQPWWRYTAQRKQQFPQV